MNGHNAALAAKTALALVAWRIMTAWRNCAITGVSKRKNNGGDGRIEKASGEGGVVAAVSGMAAHGAKAAKILAASMKTAGVATALAAKMAWQALAAVSNRQRWRKRKPYHLLSGERNR